MFNLGVPELVLIGSVALLIFGPKKVPELAKSLGRGIRDFKKALEGGHETPAPPPIDATESLDNNFSLPSQTIPQHQDALSQPSQTFAKTNSTSDTTSLQKTPTASSLSSSPAREESPSLS